MRKLNRPTVYGTVCRAEVTVERRAQEYKFSYLVRAGLCFSYPSVWGRDNMSDEHGWVIESLLNEKGR